MALALKDYLKRYESGTDSQKKKKKKQREKPGSSTMGGVLVVDEDPVWQKPVLLVEEDEEPSGDEKPQVDEDIEVKRMKRLEAIRSRKPYNAISDDGSGWVSISDSSKTSNSAVAGHDLSPPRQRRARFDTPSPDRQPKPADPGDPDRRRRFDTPSPEPEAEAPISGDLSPPRRRPREDPSPPRRVRRRSPEVEASRGSPLSDLSPPRRVCHRTHETAKPHDSSDADLSPPRRSRRGSSADLSPPRRGRSSKALRTGESPASADLSPPRKRRMGPPLAKEERTTGLLSSKVIKAEIDKKKKEDLARFASMDPSKSGRGAEPVFRDKEGKRISKEEILKLQEEEKPKEKKLEWGKGLAQKREAETKALELELEKDKPFARTRDDPELDKMLKERIRWGDPMAHLVKRKESDTVFEDLGDDEKMKESGFIVPQTVPSHSWIKRGLDFPPNRYGIRPGRHWDGVDRSSGYEKELFQRQNEKRATETEAYLWSVSDM